MHQFVNFLLPESLQERLYLSARIEGRNGEANRSASESPRSLMGVWRTVEAPTQGKPGLGHGLAEGFAVRLRRYQRQNAGLQVWFLCAKDAETAVSG